MVVSRVASCLNSKPNDSILPKILPCKFLTSAKGLIILSSLQLKFGHSFLFDTSKTWLFNALFATNIPLFVEIYTFVAFFASIKANIRRILFIQRPDPLLFQFRKTLFHAHHLVWCMPLPANNLRHYLLKACSDR